MTTDKGEAVFYSEVRPGRYNDHPCGFRCVDLIYDLPFNIACIIKYVWRHEQKDKQKDIEKSIQYCLIEMELWQPNYSPAIAASLASYKLGMIQVYSESEQKEYKASIFRLCIAYLRCMEKGILFSLLERLKQVNFEEYLQNS